MTRFTIGLLAAALLAASAPAQDSAEVTIIKTAMEKSGTEANLKMFPAGKSEMKGKMTIDGAELPFTGSMTYSVPGKVRMYLEVTVGGQKVTLEQVVNGTAAKQSENGKSVDIKPGAKDEMLQAALLQDVALLYPLLNKDSKYKLSSVVGEPNAVKVEGNGLKEITLYFDKTSGRLAKMTRTGVNPSGKDVKEVTEYSDYKDFGGLFVPTVSKVKHDDKLFLDITVTDFKPLKTTDEKFDTGS